MKHFPHPVHRSLNIISISFFRMSFFSYLSAGGSSGVAGSVASGPNRASILATNRQNSLTSGDTGRSAFRLYPAPSVPAPTSLPTAVCNNYSERVYRESCIDQHLAMGGCAIVYIYRFYRLAIEPCQ